MTPDCIPEAIEGHFCFCFYFDGLTVFFFALPCLFALYEMKNARKNNLDKLFPLWYNKSVNTFFGAFQMHKLRKRRKYEDH